MEDGPLAGEFVAQIEEGPHVPVHPETELEDVGDDLPVRDGDGEVLSGGFRVA